MANWSSTQSPGWGDISESWHATINGTKFEIVVDASTQKGTLMQLVPGKAPNVVKVGSVPELKRYAERYAQTLRASRPGEKDVMAVEDRFYMRKERFADDAKQIADTILKQLGGGRFVAMTGAKNLAYTSSPPGLSMSIGRGAKSAIKYFRVNYDKGSDTYTLIFMNNSGGRVKEIPFVHAGEMRRVFTMTTGFDTSL